MNKKFLGVNECVSTKAVIISELIDEDYKYSCIIKIKEINGEKNIKDNKFILNINKNKLKKNILIFQIKVIIFSMLKFSECKLFS